MADENKAHPFSRLIEALETSFTKSCDVFKTFIKFFFIFLCIAILAIVVATVLNTSDQAFAMSQSRLAEQLRVVSNDSSFYRDEKVEIMKLLIEQYDIENDTMNPILNPNYEPIDVASVLENLKVDGESIQMIKDSIDTIKTSDASDEDKKSW